MRRFHHFALAATLATCAAAPCTLRAQLITFSDYACAEPSQPCEYQATTGRPLTANGFEFYNDYYGFPNQLATWSANPSNLGFANRPSNIGASTALFGEFPGDVIQMNARSGRRFDLYSMDVASLFRQSSISPPFGEVGDFTLLFEYYHTLDAYTSGVPDGAFGASVAPGPLVDGDRVPLLRTVDFFGATAPGVSVQWLAGRPSDLRGAGIYGVRWTNASFGGYDENGLPVFDYGVQFTHQFTNVAAQVVPEPATLVLVGAGVCVLVGAGVRRRRVA